MLQSKKIWGNTREDDNVKHRFRGTGRERRHNSLPKKKKKKKKKGKKGRS
jgi:uncharacterized protein YueI